MKLSPEIKLTVIGVIAMLAVMPFDISILQYVHTHSDCRPFYDFITDYALGKWYIWPSGIVSLLGFALWKFKKLPPKFITLWRGFIRFFISVAGAGLATDLFKRIFARARPVNFIEHHMSGFFYWDHISGKGSYQFYSFPSGHTTTAFAVAMAIVLMLPEKYHPWKIVAFVVATIFGVARIMVEAHYTSDVIAGTMMGCWGALLVKRYLDRAKWFAALKP